jgi:cellulose synthase/poly-beta-1,6-N-acetylglucosamine synthase-like glycosyltransferase
MIWLETLVISILSVYTILIFVSIFTLLFSEKESDLNRFIPTEKVSVIIPFRNEENNIIKCLGGIIEQDYPAELMEIILVDDNSEDRSKQLAVSFLEGKLISYRLIDLKKQNLSGKKNAIEFAVAKSSKSIVITRDADTFTSNNLWLKTIAFQFKNSKADLVLVPVILKVNTFIQAFQKFENIAITSIGYAFAKNKLPFVCSGANLAYKKDSFLKANPYKDNKHIPSGDDMFLLQSFMEEGFSISTTKNTNAVVYTYAEKSLSSFINQRLRWASKTKNLHIKMAWFIGSLLFLTNILVLIIAFLGLFNAVNSNFCLFSIIYKCIIDFLLLFLGAIMYKQKINFSFYIPAFIANLFYVPLITIASISIKPSWKGRKI